MTEPTREPLVNRIDRDGVAIIELNRPARKNAIIPPMLDELAAVVTAVNADPDVYAVLLCGTGGAFCSGLDLTEFNADPPPAWLATSGASVQAAHEALGVCPHPIVVALERYAINGGAAFALAGDLIVSGRDAWLQVGEAQLGMQAPMNLAWLVARYPMATVMQVVLAGERIPGPELHRLGIAYEVVDDGAVRARAEELAATIAAFPPGAARRLKSAALCLAESGPIGSEWFTRAAALAPAAAPPPTR
ncbi:MAG: enoyl-CoA hydratase/isomerase family protein [Ilumatobacteraceae bacterium]